jgi:hypothetical protein
MVPVVCVLRCVAPSSSLEARPKSLILDTCGVSKLLLDSQ